MSRKNKLMNSAQVMAGKVEEATGRALGDHRLARHGRVEQLKGQLKQAREKVLDVLRH